MATDLEDLVKRLDLLPIDAQLTVAAVCCKEGKYDLAEAIAERAVSALRARCLLGAMDRRDAHTHPAKES